ncbi:cobyrinic acid a,c-diamide synthase [endosymbiont of Acanthamoeba sp. UWC8]|nr:cobyrinic acid a,c-diamide synthase [endosymbiont of Acanthamoeba sp. UWC8]
MFIISYKILLLIENLMNDCCTITISQQKGGSGKTTIAAHLAVSLSQMNKRVAVIDIDPQGSLSRWHSIRQERYGDGFTGINLISKAGWKVQNEIFSLKTKYDYIIIDSPPHNETDAKTAIRTSDLVIIPMQPSPTDLWATDNTTSFCKQNNIPYQILLNRVPPNSKILPTLTKNLENILKTTIGNRVAFSSSFLDGKCITETQPNSPAAKEIKELVNEIITAIKIIKSGQVAV